MRLKKRPFELLSYYSREIYYMSEAWKAGGWSLGQRNGRPATWVDLAGIDPRDQTQGI